MRPTFGREYIEDEFRSISTEISDPLTVYLIGGGALSLRDLKTATKDIDLVLETSDGYARLWDVLVNLGYDEVESLGQDYRDLGATCCVENDDGCRLDVFNRQIAEKLVLSEDMVERSEAFLDTDPLTVRLVSNEDILLFKTVAGRDDDIEDMNVLVQTGLDFEVIRTELDVQIEQLGDDRFLTYANEALIDLEEQYGVTTPIGERMRELTERYYQGLELLHALEGPTTTEALVAELDTAADEIEERIAYLERFDRVIRHGEEIEPTVRYQPESV